MNLSPVTLYPVTFVLLSVFMKNPSRLICFLLVLLMLTSCMDMSEDIAATSAGQFAIYGAVILAFLIWVTGFGLIIAGCYLVYAGYTGDIQLIVESDTFAASIINASPGIILVILGVCIIIYRAKIDLHIPEKGKDSSKED